MNYRKRLRKNYRAYKRQDWLIEQVKMRERDEARQAAQKKPSPGGNSENSGFSEQTAGCPGRDDL